MPRSILVSHSPADLTRPYVIEIHPGDAGHTTLSDYLTPDSCRKIDDDAYAFTRHWYRGRPDIPEVVGAVLEYPLTLAAIEYLRAREVLRVAAQRFGLHAVQLSGVSTEWLDAAEDLELDLVEPVKVSDDIRALVRPRRPTTAMRLLALAFARRAHNGIALFEATPPMLPTADKLIGREPIFLVNPSRGVLARLVSVSRRTSVAWPARPSANSVDDRSSNLRGLARIASRLGAAMQPSINEWYRQAHDWQPLRAAIAPQDMTPLVRTGIRALRNSGTRTITLEHGIGGWYRHQIFTAAEHLAVWGEPHASYHRRRQPIDTVIDVVGSSRMEAIWRRGRLEDATALWDVVFFAQPSPPLSASSWPEDYARALRFVRAYSSMRPNRRVAVKEHPAMPAYRTQSAPGGSLQSLRGDAVQHLLAARVVVVVTSTAGLEAMALGRPVVQVPPKVEIGDPSFIGQSGAALVADSEESFAEAVDKLLVDSALRRALVERGKEYAAHFVTGIDRPGFAADRIRTLVNESA